MLERFQGFVTQSPEINREILVANFNVRHFDGRFKERPFVAKGNWADTKYVRITSAFCSTSTSMVHDAAPAIRQFFQARSKTHLQIGMEGRSQEVSDANASVVIPADIPYRCVATGPHEILALRVEPKALRAVASAMLGEEISTEEVIAQRWTHTDSGMRSAAFQFAADLQSGVASDSHAAEVFGQALLVRFVMGASLDWNERLKKHVSSPSLFQLRRVESYLAANWRKDVDVEQLSEEFGLSVRSIFRYFKTLRGLTPQEFLKQLRLDKARAMLETDESKGVMRIALLCGFQGAGHFAREYRNRFGELPSQTLLRSRFVKSKEPEDDQ